MRGLELDAKLCFIRDNWAYFSTREPTEMEGDDWDDAYDCNGGAPYPSPDYTLEKIGFSGVWSVPIGNLSTTSINEGIVPWLMPQTWSSEQVPIPAIMAGTTLREFIKIIEEVGGIIYVNYRRA